MSRNKELQELLKASGVTTEEYHKMYWTTYQQIHKGYNKRYSGRKYTNTPERLQAIKDKYANGVTPEILAEMFNN